MKKLIISVLAIAAFVVAPVSVSAQVAALSVTREAEGKVKIINPITLQNNNGLDFGTIASLGNAAFTATAPASAVTDVTLSTGAQQLYKGQSAMFTVTGEVGQNYTITIPTTDLTLNGGTGEVKIKSFTCSKTGAQAMASGDNVFYVGGTLDAAASAHGSFTANFPVTVQYQ